jgi:hypothetical protein
MARRRTRPHRKPLTITRLRVVIFQEGTWRCARCLEYDIGTQARTQEALLRDLTRMIVGHIALSIRHGLRPFATVGPAPKKYWEMFKRSKLSLPLTPPAFRIQERGITLPPPEIRIAPLAA